MAAHRPGSVTPDVVRRIAGLARLRVPDPELPSLTAQLARVVDHIDQIREIPPEALPVGLPPPPTPLRADAASPGDGERALASNAPRLLHGHGVVPRVVGTAE